MPLLGVLGKYSSFPGQRILRMRQLLSGFTRFLLQGIELALVLLLDMYVLFALNKKVN
jgi:hypothetical protein